jgi:hypothetical protein
MISTALTAGLLVAGLMVPGAPASAAPDRFAPGGSGSCDIGLPLDPTLQLGEDFDLLDADDRPVDADGKWMRAAGERGSVICVALDDGHTVAMKVRPSGLSKPVHLPWGRATFWVEHDGARSGDVAINLDCWDAACRPE